MLRLPLNGYGSTTFRSEAKERGVDKLAVYDGFGVPEVWLFEGGAFTIHRRKPSPGCVRTTKSTLLPELDFDLLAKLSATGNQQTALEALERAVRGVPPKKPRRRRSG